MHNIIYIVESYDYEGEPHLHRLWFSSIESATVFGKKILFENYEEVLGFNIFELEQG